MINYDIRLRVAATQMEPVWYNADETTSLIPVQAYFDYHCGDDSENINANEEISYTKKFCYFFNENSYQADDSAKFIIRANIKTDVAQALGQFQCTLTIAAATEDVSHLVRVVQVEHNV